MQGASGILRKWRKWSMGYQVLSLPVPTSFKRNKRSPVTVVVGKEKKTFKVESQILEYYQFQPLLEKASVGDRECCIFLTCDAILFEHMLWLVDTHDPSLRSLNVELLLEFYAQESDHPNTASSLLWD
ncbi:hypothetical protein SUGI_0393820 [Cryptomeria japonica]|nr:hypothetical protein SUGI_0393820 [Cryptomeria japonica]